LVKQLLAVLANRFGSALLKGIVVLYQPSLYIIKHLFLYSIEVFGWERHIIMGIRLGDSIIVRIGVK
jgi:hypothetical protein